MATDGIDPKTAEELAKAAQNVKNSVDATTKSFEEQLRIMMQMRDVMSQLSDNLDKMGNQDPKGALSPDQMKKLSKEIENSNLVSKNATTGLQKLGKTLQSPLVKNTIIATSALSGLWQGFKNLFALSKASANFIGSVTGGLFSLTKSILAVPKNALNFLFAKANEQGDNALAQAIEEVRREFGDLKSDASKAIIGTAQHMGKLNAMGVDTYRVFGNAAERLRAVTEMVKGIGPAVGVFTKEIQESGVEMAAFQKGLGLSNDQMQQLASIAMSQGKKITDVQLDMTKQAVGFGKSMGLNAKIISKDMGRAMQDLAHFGHLSTKELSVAAAYAQKLGVSIEKLTGIMDATMTFDQAAEGMGKLNEQFGTNIDAMKMMSAQTGQEKIEMLRDAFAKTGKDLSKLTLQEKQLIKTSTGMDDAMLNAVAAAQGQGDILGKLNAQADKNEKKTVTQAEAIHELAAAMEKIPQAGGGGQGGPFQHFLDGIAKGITSSPEFIKIITNLRETFRVATQYGFKLGRMFVDVFPGIKDMMKGTAELFQPARFRKLFEGILKTFEIFKKGGVSSFDDFMKGIQKNFTDFFDAGKPSGTKVLEGFKQFGKVVYAIFGKISEWVFNKLADVVQGIADWINKPKLPKVDGNGIGNAIKSPMEGALNALVDKLGPALMNLGEAIWDRIKQALASKVGTVFKGAVLATVLAPALTSALGGVAAAMMFKKAGEGMASSMGTGLGEGLTSKASALKKGLQGSMPSPKEITDTITPDPKTRIKLEEMGKSGIQWPKVTSFVTGLAGFYTFAMGLFAAAAAAASKFDAATVGKATILLVGISMMLGPAASAFDTISKIGAVDMKSVNNSLKGIAEMLAIGMTAFGVALFAVKALKISAGDIATAGLMMAGVGETLLIGLGIVKIATMIKGVEAATEGLIAMGLVVAGMVGVAVIIGGITALIGANEMNAGANILKAVSESFMVAAGVVGVAMIAGGIILGTAGAGAVALAAGLSAIAASVGTMVGTGLVVMEELSRMKGDPGTIKKRASAFASIMEAISGMTNQIALILKGLDFGFFESESSKIAKMDSVKGLIKTLINGEDGNGGIQGIINSVIDGLGKLDESKIKSAQAFAGVLSAVGSLMSSTSEPLSKLQSGQKHWYEFSNSASETTQIMDGAKNFIIPFLETSKGLIDGIVNSIGGIKNPEVLKPAAESISSIFGAIGSLYGAISPKAEDFKQHISVAGASFERIDENAISSTSKKLTDIMKTLNKYVPELISGIMNSISGPLGSLTPEQLKTLPVIGNILAAIGTIIDSVSKGAGGFTVEKEFDGDKVKKEITKSVPTITDLLNGISEAVPGLLWSVIGISRSIGSKGIPVQTVKNIAKFLEEIGKMTSTISSATAGLQSQAAPGEGPIQVIGKNLGFMFNVFELLVKGKSGSVTGVPLAHLSGILGDLKPELIQSLAAKANTAKSITSFLDSVSKINASISGISSSAPSGDNLKNIGNSLANTKESLKSLTTGKENIISSIVTELDKIDKSISGIKPGTGSKKLETLANNLSSLSTSVSLIATSGKSINDIVGDEGKGMPAFKEIFNKLNSKISVDEITVLAKGNEKQVRSAVSASIATVKAMAKVTQEMDDALSKLPKLNVGAKLSAISGKMGLGGEAAYTVKSKDVIINVNMTVTMNAGEVEKVIISNAESKIRDRINFAINNGSASDIEKKKAFIKTNPKSNDGMVGRSIQGAD